MRYQATSPFCPLLALAGNNGKGREGYALTHLKMEKRSLRECHSLQDKGNIDVGVGNL